MSSPQNQITEWITLNIATIITAGFGFLDGKLLLEILGGCSLVVLMFFNFYRGMNQYMDYREKKHDEAIRKRDAKMLAEKIVEELHKKSDSDDFE